MERPAKALKGFQRIAVPAGKSVAIHLPLKAEDLKFWSEKRHSFVLETGSVELMVGAASDDIRLRGKLEAR